MSRSIVLPRPFRHLRPATLLIAALMILAAGCALVIGVAQMEAGRRDPSAAPAVTSAAASTRVDGRQASRAPRRAVRAAGARDVAPALPARVPGQPTVTQRTATAPVPTQTGTASWYGEEFAGQRTASGQVFDPSALTCAHLTLPFGTQLEVTNLANGASVVVTVTDRGPYAGGRIIDLSSAAADAIGMKGAGTATVSIAVAS